MKRLSALLLAFFFLPWPVAAQKVSKFETDAKKAFDAGRFKEAGEKFAAAAAAESAPEQKADLYLRSAWAHYIGNNTKSAREGLKSAFAAQPRLQVIADFYSPDFSKLAQSVRAEVSGGIQADTEEIKRVARDMLAGGKAEEALQALRRAEGSQDPQVHHLLADTYDRLGRTAEAEAARRRALELEKTHVADIGAPPSGAGGGPVPIQLASFLEAARNALKAGDARLAESLTRRAVEADPTSAQAHRLAGEAAFLLEQDADAEKAFTAAISLDPRNPEAEFGLAKVGERQKKWNTAASHYRRVLELDPRNVPAARGQGRAMKELGDATGARLAYGRAVEIDPSSPEARNDFGVFLFHAGELDRATEELIEAVRLDPQRSVFHENLGRAYRKRGMVKEAERELAEAGRAAPNERAVWASLGHLRAEQRKPAEAATAYASAFHLDPGSEEAASGLGSALSDAGKLADAEAALAKALESNPRSAILWNNLGVVRTRLQNFARAVEAFHKAIDLDAGLEAARFNLARARQLLALERAAA